MSEGVAYVQPVLVTSVAMSTSNGAEQKNPEKAVMALELLAEGKGYQAVGEATGLTFDQIVGLRARHIVAIEVRRKQLAEDGFEMAEGLRLLAKQKMAMLADDPDALAKVNLRDLAISYGVAVDKGMLALDGNKVVVEHVSRKPSLQDAMQAIADAKAALRSGATQVEAIDVTPKAGETP